MQTVITKGPAHSDAWCRGGSRCLPYSCGMLIFHAQDWNTAKSYSSAFFRMRHVKLYMPCKTAYLRMLSR